MANNTQYLTKLNKDLKDLNEELEKGKEFKNATSKKLIKKSIIKKMYSQKADYVKKQKEYELQVQLLDDKRKVVLDMFEMLKDNRNMIIEDFEVIVDKKEKLAQQEEELINSIKGKFKNSNNNSEGVINLSSILEDTINTDGDKFFTWPSKENTRITAYYQDPEYYKALGWQHDGIDIAMPQASPVYAPAAGYVYKVVDNNSDYYNYIVLVHNYGYITLYGHVSKSYVKAGSTVTRGQIIGLSGGAKGTRGAGKLSTGPHLHFEVYKNGQHIDPLSVLDLSVYKNESSISERYHFKHMKDIIMRKIDISSLTYYPDTLTHYERQKAFLKRAASGFNNADIWIQSGKKYGIDPDVAICIGYAESGLGTNTTTKYNIGNVGNNDRGDRIGFDSALQGINQIYFTLNNVYMSKYNTIYSLSRFGNKDGTIYSSSNYNWYNNVTRCLSVIKGHPIDEYYPFRELNNTQLNQAEMYKRPIGE